jgi:hypothetical protein
VGHRCLFVASASLRNAVDDTSVVDPRPARGLFGRKGLMAVNSKP